VFSDRQPRVTALQPFAAALFGGLSAATAVRALAVAGSRRATMRGGGVRDRSGRSRGDTALRLLAQTRRLLPSAVALAGRRDIRSLIARAGLVGRVSTRDLAAARVLCLGACSLLIPRLAAAVPLRMLPALLTAWCFAAAELPVWWLRRRAARRTADLMVALPDALELLRACLSAGLPLRRSLLLVGDHCAEPVAGEFLCVATETAFGIPQATALDGLVARNPLPEVRALVSAMRQAERHGSPLAPVIAAQAHDARLALNRQIIERGARAGPKIQLIVSLTIVPAAMLGFAAVTVAAIIRGDLRFL
jgi:tight adherence protein C